MERDTAKLLAREISDIGKDVAMDARGRLARVSARSAGGIRHRVRRRLEIQVEQRKGRTTGERPDWGAFQMREALVPARSAKVGETYRRLEDVLDRVGRMNGF
jgi:hypothetical protein